MNRLLSRCLTATVVLCGALSLGCPSSVYNSETTLNDDGSVERVVYQPSEETSEDVRKAELWKKMTYAPDPETLKKQKFMGSFADLPPAESGKDTPYFVGVARVKAVKDLPDYFVKKAVEKSGLPDAKLVRQYSRTDYGLVVEHRWSETLTDVVTQEGMWKAREELADFLISVFAETFEEAYGKSWDASGLVRWLNQEAKPWWAEMTDYLYIHCLNHKEANAEEMLGEGLRAICRRRGLMLRSAAEDKDNGGESQMAVLDFALGVLCKNVSHKKSGKALDVLTAMKWLDDFNKDPDPNAPEGKQPVWKPALARVITAKYGGKEAFDERVGVLLARTFGLFYPESFFRGRTFDYRMTVPGDVVETNGQVMGNNKVSWSFPANLAYPRGYTMTVRSLTLNEELHKAVLKDEPLKDVKGRQGFVYLMKWGPEGLREAVLESCKQKSPAPLEAYRKKATPEEKEWLSGLEQAFKPGSK